MLAQKKNDHLTFSVSMSNLSAQRSAMVISCVIQRIFKRLDNTLYRVALAHNEDRTSIHKSATTPLAIATFVSTPIP
jgi:hypothetical protein